MAHSCRICNEEFNSQRSVSNHMRKHEDVVFMCNEPNCQLAFISIGDFNTHHNLHKDELKCDVCQRSFYKKSALNTHIASVHNKEKKFFCQQPKCSKGFYRKTDLVIHQQLHNNKKEKYKCETCSKSFSHISNLNRHKRLHTKEKFYCCNVCNKRFTQSATLTRHKETHDASTKLRCRLCDQIFVNQILLKNHIERIHDSGCAEDTAKQKSRGFFCYSCGDQFEMKIHLGKHKLQCHTTNTTSSSVTRTTDKDQGSTHSNNYVPHNFVRSQSLSQQEEVEKLSHNDVTKQEHLNYRIVNRQGGNIHRGGELLDSNNAQENNTKTYKIHHEGETSKNNRDEIVDVVYALEENDDDNLSDDSDYTINSSMESECGMCYPVSNNQQTCSSQINQFSIDNHQNLPGSSNNSQSLNLQANQSNQLIFIQQPSHSKLSKIQEIDNTVSDRSSNITELNVMGVTAVENEDDNLPLAGVIKSDILKTENLKPVLHGINKPIPRTCDKELNPAATQNNILTNKGSVIKLASSLDSNSSLTQAAETPFLIQAADSLSAPVNISSQSVSVKNSEATITLTKPSPTIQSTINSSVIRYSSSSSNIIQPIILPQVQSSPLPINNEDLSKNSKVVNLPNYNKSKEKPLIAKNVKKSFDIEEIHQTTNKIENKSAKRKTGMKSAINEEMSHTHVIKTIRRIVKDLAHPNVKEDDVEQLDQIQKTEENAICDNTDVNIAEEKLGPADIDVPILQEKITKPAKKFECKECGMGFDKPCHLEFHKGVHDESLKKFSCDICHVRFCWKSRLKQHMAAQHSELEEIKVFTCNICDKKFSAAHSLKDHKKRIHLKERSIVCSQCSKQFYKKSDLKVHMRTHMKSKPYSCKFCSKQFAHISHMYRHEKIHSRTIK